MPYLKLVASLRGHSGPVWSVRWSPSGLLSSCGADRKVRIWSSTSTIENNQDNIPTSSSSSSTSSFDEWKLVTTSAPDAFLRAVRDTAWSPDGRSVAAASFDASATILELVGGREPRLEAAVCLEGHDAEVKSVSYSSGGGLLATCSRDRSIWVWQAGLDFDYECIAVLNAHRGDVKKVKWHPHIELLVSASFDGSVRVWVEDEDDWFCSEQLVAHADTVWDIAFNHDGNALASVSADKTLIVWKREAPAYSNVIGANATFEVAARVDDLSTEALYAVDWGKFKDTDVIAVGSGDDCIRIVTKVQKDMMDMDNGGVNEEEAGDQSAKDTEKEQGVAEEEGEESRTSSRLTEKWKVECCRSRAHTGDVNGVAWSPVHPGLLASCGDDGLVRIWHYVDSDEGES